MAQADISYVIDTTSRYAVGAGKHLVARYNARTGEITNSHPILEDLGDVLPFLWYCDGKETAKFEFENAKRLLSQDLMYQNPQCDRDWMVYTYDWTDLLHGLIEYHRLAADSEAIDLANTLFSAWEQKFTKNNIVFGRGIKFGHIVLPIPLSTLNDVGMFPELILNFGRCFSDERSKQLKKLACSIVDQWLCDPITKQTGLFPTVLSPVISAIGIFRWFCAKSVYELTRKRSDSVILFKHNTNAIASVLAVFKETGSKRYADAIRHWSEGLSKYLLQDNGTICTEWRIKDGVIKEATSVNFQVVDLMCDIAQSTREQCYLEIARKVANTWISMRGKTGLIPHQNFGTRKGQGLSDMQTDFSVALVKLSVLTGDAIYSEAAEEIMSAVRRHLYMECGMATWVDTDTGTVIDSECKTKFHVLSLKGWLALEHKDKIYIDNEFTEMLGDR